MSREDFIDDLVDLLDGHDAAYDRYASLLESDVFARDLLHEAEEAADRLADAGADYVAPADMVDRVLAALDGTADFETATISQSSNEVTASGIVTRQSSGAPAESESTAGVTNATPPLQSKEASDAGLTDSRATFGAVSPSAKTSRGESDLTAHKTSSVSTGDSPRKNSAERRRRPVLAVVTALAFAAAALVGLAWMGGLFGEGSEEPQVAGSTNGSDTPDYTLSFRVLQAETMPANAEQPAGSTFSSGNARAQLALSDGTELLLDRQSEVIIGEGGRTIDLRRGRLVAEVSHLDPGPHAHFLTPTGRVEVLGTKFVLDADDDVSSVRVIRGAVRAHGTGTFANAHVDVKAGEEGVMANGAAPVQRNAVGLGPSVDWAAIDETLPARGLGELRAHRPGERQEEERALTLGRHTVDVRIVGNVARTQIEERFDNDENVELEGVYSFPIPPGARIASLQLKVDGRWEEGAFVSKEQGTQIWRGVMRNAAPRRAAPREEFIWVEGPWRDPALLEWQQGGRFQLRIYPIPAHGSREIRLTYEETIAPFAGGRRYVYPLPYATDDSTEVGEFAMNVQVRGAERAKLRGYEEGVEGQGESLRMARSHFQPSGDIIIDYEIPDGDAALRAWAFEGDAVAPPPLASRESESVRATQAALVRDGRPYALFALRPERPPAATQTARDYVLVVDSSQSMVGERYERAIRLATTVAEEMDRSGRVTAVACDLTCQAMPGALQLPSETAAQNVERFLRELAPAGASNLAANLQQAAELARQAGGGSERPLQLIYFGDGVATMGPSEAGSLGSEIEQNLRNQGVRLTTVGIGQDADSRMLANLARRGGGHYVPFVPGLATEGAALAVLETTYGESLESTVVELPRGVEGVGLERLANIRSGQELLIAARLDQPQIEGEVVLRGKLGDTAFEQRFAVSLRSTSARGNAFVPRVWASEMIKALEDGDMHGDDDDTVIALSKGYGVMSRSTSLLVLESEAMFRAFGVDRARPHIEWTGEEPMETAVTHQPTQQEPLRTRRQSAVVGFNASGAGGLLRNEPAVDELADSLDSGADASSRPAARPREAEAEASRADLPRASMARRRGRMRRLRKVWFREGYISRDLSRERDLVALRRAEERLAAEPNSRDRHRALVRALSRAGRLEEAETAARTWLGRDQLDWEALTYLSDAVGRQGRQEEALRLLSGIVDLEPDNAILQARMAQAFERADDRERACAHRRTAAEQAPSSATERALAQCDGTAVETDVVWHGTRHRRRRPARPTRRVSGDFMAHATWSTDTDLDLSLITPEGTRLSWMGGRRNVVGEGGRSRREERLGLSRGAPGRYYVEIARTDKHLDRPVSGQVQLRVPGGTSRTLDFTIPAGASQATVGSVRVVRRWVFR